MAALSDKEKINLIFEKAYEDNVEIELMFLLDKCQFSLIRGICVMVKNRHFVVRVPLEKLEEEQIIWGAEVDGYFLVRTDDVKPVHFRTRLVRMYNAPPESMFLVFPYPKTIDFEERRNSRRVNISRDQAHGFGIWYGELQGGDLTTIPKQIWRPFENEECELGELSASGLRVDFPQNGTLAGTLAVGDPILLKGDFGTDAKPAPIYVLGSIVRKMRMRERPDMMSAGCHFSSFRPILGPKSERWFRAHPQEGIGQINQWLRRRPLNPTLL